MNKRIIPVENFTGFPEILGGRKLYILKYMVVFYMTHPY